MSGRLLFIVLLICYGIGIVPFAAYLKSRPVAIKLGYTPSAEVLRVVVGDQKLLTAHAAVVRVLIYFGSLVDKSKMKLMLEPEYLNMYKTLQTAVKLDPYNNDSYYFSQAAFAWEVGRAAEVNLMLDYGMKFRTWDYMLPFFAGFNAAYFLKQYDSAAGYMKKAAEISGNPLLTNLAARYYYESNNNELGIRFLEMMEAGAKDESTRELYSMRRSALQAVSRIQGAVLQYRKNKGRSPQSVEELLQEGILKELPSDPYGGSFYIDGAGSVRTTSKFAFGGRN